MTQSVTLLNRNVTNATYEASSSARVQSLLNPDNIHTFLFEY